VPGLTLTLTAEDRDCDSVEAGSRQTVLLHGPHYRANSGVVRPGLHLGWVAYDEYPARVFWSDGALVYVEGRVYNRPADAVRCDLASLAATALGSDRSDAEVERFMLANEGSYVVAIVRPDNREVLVFTDPFCRLPLYYSADDARLFLAREAKFVHFLRPKPALDRVGCAQFLAFGLPLGDRTVLEGVKSFPDAGLLRAEANNGRLRWRLRTLRSWNLDDEDRSKSVRRQASEFAELFLASCQNWGTHAENTGNVVSLSGGHDSRAVAAGLARSATVVAVTYRDPNGRREEEVRCARKLAEALNIQWHCIDVPSPSESAYEELAWLKDGMNWSSMAYILGYLEEIVRRWGRNRTYLSGDGGDDCLKVTAPSAQFRRFDEVIRYILEKETCIRPGDAEAIMKVPAGTLQEELRTLFDSYPERALAQRIKHFKIFERGRRCYFEGEDRTRSFLWQDSPFYSLPLFQHCMRVPDRSKHYKLFCREALMALSPVAASIPVNFSGHPPDSLKYLLYHWARETVLNLPTPLVKLTRFLTGNVPEGRYLVPRPYATYLQDGFSRNTPLAELLDGDAVLEALERIDDAHAFFCFWTIVMLEKAYQSRMGYGVR
jgi:asparagine synthase (glutamine-hydrolysing)